MSTHHLLTVRTNAALGRLSSLQKRAEKVPIPAAPVVKSALKELSESLEELQVINEQLQHQVDESSEWKDRVRAEHARLREFVDVLPVPCVYTSEDGRIEEANSAAADLLNVSAQHLAGRPLVLFFSDRTRFGECLAALNQRLTTVVEFSGIMRPRERRARTVRLIGRRLERDDRRCWFLLENLVDADSAPA